MKKIIKNIFESNEQMEFPDFVRDEGGKFVYRINGLRRRPIPHGKIDKYFTYLSSLNGEDYFEDYKNPTYIIWHTAPGCLWFNVTTSSVDYFFLIDRKSFQPIGYQFEMNESSEWVDEGDEDYVDEGYDRLPHIKKSWKGTPAYNSFEEYYLDPYINDHPKLMSDRYIDEEIDRVTSLLKVKI